MKIGLIGQKGVPATYGGVERHVEELAAALAARGHDVCVYSRPHYSPQAQPTYRGFRVLTLPSLPTKHLDAISHAALASLDALRRGYDVVHYHAVGPALLCGVPRLAGQKTVVTVHALDWLRQKWGAAARASLRAGAAATRLADAVIVVSQGLGDEMSRRYGIHATFIPNGVETPQHVPLEFLRDRLGLRDRKFILFLGRFVPEKGCDLLIRAYREVKTELPLVLAGEDGTDGACLAELKELARGDGRILFPGGLYGREKAEALGHAAVFVLPSRIEGMPIGLLEALAYGVPCLVSDIPEIREVLASAGAGNTPTFRAGDEDDLRGKLASLVQGAAIVATAPEIAARVISIYDWAAIAARTEAIYRSL